MQAAEGCEGGQRPSSARGTSGCKPQRAARAARGQARLKARADASRQGPKGEPGGREASGTRARTGFEKPEQPGRKSTPRGRRKAHDRAMAEPRARGHRTSREAGVGTHEQPSRHGEGPSGRAHDGRRGWHGRALVAVDGAQSVPSRRRKQAQWRTQPARIRASQGRPRGQRRGFGTQTSRRRWRQSTTISPRHEVQATSSRVRR